MTPPPRLSQATLSAADATQAGFDRKFARTGVVHLGLGAFSRAHLAVYFDDLVAADPDVALGITGVSLRSPDVSDALTPQDGLYTLRVVDGVAAEHRVVGSVARALHAPSDPAEVRSVLASPDTTVISVTVTEKGYCVTPSSRRLDVEHPDVRHDLDVPTNPRGLLGHLLLACSDRMAAGTAAPTVLSLDNMAANGRTLRGVMLEFAAASDPAVAEWIEQYVRFPCSMVDRMVPATTPAVVDAVADATGCLDQWPVVCEPYSIWVVERDWATPIPPLDSVGVHLVDDVTPWETMKLRVLNGLHTTAAHHGLAFGHDTVDAVVADAEGRDLLARVGAEIIEVVDGPDGIDIAEYLTTTLGRFANSGLGHRCDQIATDTSQKLPQRLLDTLRTRLERGLPIDAICEVVSLWAWSTLGRDHEGRARTVDDPLADEFSSIAQTHTGDPTAVIAELLSIEQIFGDLAGDERVLAATLRCCESPLWTGRA